jgi:isopentenyl phosphate kinase
MDLKDGIVPIRQRQYRLNPKYSLKVKEELEKLLETRFIYPVKHSEWVFPIAIVPKKVGADGVAKIQVCQDYRKLNDATKKGFYPLPFTDIILDHAVGHEIYTS